MLHLIAVFAMGFLAAGLVLLVYKLRGVKAPRYLVPMAAGLAMIGYSVWSDYSWASRTIDGLPDHVRVVKEISSSAPWKPWTYLIPQVDRFIALDSSETRRNERLPGFVMAEVILVAQREPAVTTRQLFDCTQSRRTDILPTAEFTDDGMPVAPQWVPLEPGDALYQQLCAGS